MPGSYAMAFGALDPRKNSELLLRLWALHDMPWDLLLVGAEPKALRRWRTKFGARASIHIRGFEPDNRVRGLMQHAAAFLYPSYYEGFGLPVLEAQSLGVPVILAEGTAATEVAQGIALSVPAGDLVSWKIAIDRLASDDALRQEFSTLGPRVAASYSWTDAALGMLELYASSC